MSAHATSVTPGALPTRESTQLPARDPAYTDLRVLSLLWLLGLASLASSTWLGGWFCPFEALTGLPGPVCNASTAIRFLLDGAPQDALATHATATLAAAVSVVAMPALLAYRFAQGRGRWQACGVYYHRVRPWIWSGFMALLLLQWCWTLSRTLLLG